MEGEMPQVLGEGRVSPMSVRDRAGSVPQISN